MNDNILPADFDGVFRFTNSSDRDFTAKWGGVQYTFPAMKTTPMLISGATPEEVQSIRKKFAREFAEREFYQSKKLKSLEGQTPIGSVSSFQNATVYSGADLAPYVQQSLEALPIAQAEVKISPKKKLNLHTDDEGKPTSKIVDKDAKLVEGTPA